MLLQKTGDAKLGNERTHRALETAVVEAEVAALNSAARRGRPGSRPAGGAADRGVAS
jgi:hypothetical protein